MVIKGANKGLSNWQCRFLKVKSLSDVNPDKNSDVRDCQSCVSNRKKESRESLFYKHNDRRVTLAVSYKNSHIKTIHLPDFRWRLGIDRLLEEVLSSAVIYSCTYSSRSKLKWTFLTRLALLSGESVSGKESENYFFNM